jgi:hypothetical protein
MSSVLLVAILSFSATARADDNFGPGAGFSFVLVGLPILDGVIFMGGVAAATGATAALHDHRPSLGWKKLGYAFGSLNAVSTVGYAVAMGITGMWPFLIWPCLAHAGLSIADFSLAYQNRAPDERSARIAFVPLGAVDVRGGLTGGFAFRATF